MKVKIEIITSSLFYSQKTWREIDVLLIKEAVSKHLVLRKIILKSSNARKNTFRIQAETSKNLNTVKEDVEKELKQRIKVYSFKYLEIEVTDKDVNPSSR